MEINEVIEKCEKIFHHEPVSRRLRMVRMLYILSPEINTLKFFIREISITNEKIVGELLEKIALINPESLIEYLKKLSDEGYTELRKVVEKELATPKILNIIFNLLNNYLEKDLTEDKFTIQKVEDIKKVISDYRNDGMIFHIIYNLYNENGELREIYKGFLDFFPSDQILRKIDLNINSLVPQFMINAIFYLKSIKENKRAKKFLEEFSKNEYGMTSHEVLEKINDELRSEKDDKRKKVLLITSSTTMERAISNSISNDIVLYSSNSKVNVMVKNKILEVSPSIVIVDKSIGNGIGLEIAEFIKKFKEFEQRVIIVADYISEFDKESMAKHRIDYIYSPFTADEMKKKIDSIFDTLSREKVINKAKIVLRGGELLFNEGDIGNCCYVIQSGKIKIWRSDGSGNEIVLTTIGAGEIFGEMAIIDDDCSKRSAAATAVERTELLRIEEGNFDTVLKSNPSFSMKMIKILVSRLRNVTNRLKELESLSRY